jgi:uridine kinase
VQPEPADVAALAARVRETPPRLGATRLVTVDGPAGSGKTTLADLLGDALDGCPVVHMDDLYRGWSGLGPDVWDRLHRQVLSPLAAGQPARYQVYDWDAGRFDRWVDLPIPARLVVEGVGAAARRVDAYASLRVWVEAPRDLRTARGVARDGEALRAQWLRWAAEEDAHFTADATRARADVLVDGTVPVV